MAQVPYSAGVPSAAPQTGVPDDSQHLTPAAAQGGEALGQGLSQAGQFYDQAAADDQTNQTLNSMTDLLYGTGKPVQQPDGSMVPDTGFFGLKGGAALKAAPDIQQKMQAIFQAGSNNLQTPESKLQYDSFVRRYRISVSGDIGRFTDQQNQTWAQSVNADGVNVALRSLATNPTDQTTVNRSTADILNFTMKSAQLRGATPGDPVSQDMAAGALQQIVITRINAIGAANPQAAVDLIKKERAVLGPRISSNGTVSGDTYGTLLNQYQAKANEQFGVTNGTAIYNAVKASPAAPAATVSPVGNAAISQAVSTATGHPATLGMLNNNPGNIKFNPSINWQGQLGPSQTTDQGDPQVLFASQDAGMRALAKNVLYKFNQGSTTIQQLIAGPGGWTPGYEPGAVGVARAAGLSPTQAINMQDPAILHRVLRGIVTQEHGPAAAYYTDAMIDRGISSASGTEVAPTGTSAVPEGAVASTMGVAPAGGPAGMESVPAGGIPSSPDAVGAVAAPVPLAPLPSGQNQPPLVPLSPRAAAYQAIQAHADWTPEQRNAAFRTVDQLASQDQIASDQRDLAARQQLDQAARSVPVAIMATGAYGATLPTADDFSRAYGPVEGPAKWQAFNSSVNTATTSFAMKTMPADQITQAVEGARPSTEQASGIDAADAWKSYQDVSAAAEHILKSRQTDPNGYVQSAFPTIAQAWSSVKTPQDFQNAVAMTAVAEQKLGIPPGQMALVPKNMAVNAANSFKNEELPSDQRLAAITSLVMGTNDPSQQQSIFNQLVKAGVPAYSRGAFRALERGDDGAAQTLFRAAMTDPSKLPDTLPTGDSIADIKKQIQTQLFDTNGLASTVYGLTNGSARNFDQAQEDGQLLTNAVALRLRDGSASDLSDAISLTAKDMFGDKKVIAASGTDVGNAGMKVAVDASVSQQQVQAGFDALLPKVRDALTSYTQQALPFAQGSESLGSSGLQTALQREGVTSGESAVSSAIRDNFVRNALTNGYFVNSGANGFSFIEPKTGTAVPGSDGQPLVFTQQEMLGGAAQAALAQAHVQAGAAARYGHVR